MVARKDRERAQEIPRRITNRQRRRIHKLRPKMVVGPRGVSVRNLITHESDCLLTQREQHLIRVRIAYMEAAGRVELKHLDFRYWEIRRRTGWNPDASDWRDPRTVYDWWATLPPGAREELAMLSREAGMRDDGEGRHRKRKVSETHRW